MEIITAYATKNECYIAGKAMTPKGIVVHSTGANNPYLRRYCDSPDELGANKYGNHWNVARPSGSQICVHSFIGYDKNEVVKVCNILPYKYACWGCGSGSKGSYNYNPQGHIQFEICEDGLTDETYFNAVYNVAVDYCVYLCKQFNLSADTIVSHKEAHAKGYASNHGDPEHWFTKHGKTMNDFRAAVKAKLNSSETTTTTKTFKKGDVVKVVGTYYYDGKTKVPSWVKADKWVVSSVRKDRVVIDKNAAGTNSINSPVNAADLEKVETVPSEAFKAYLAKVTVSVLNIRAGAGTNYKIVGEIRDYGTYTIVAEANGTGATKWGKLKSGAGWISLDYVKKV